ncbi:MAG: ATP-binding protein [Candidatus Heimdallarchaeota archaeon]
MFKQITVISGKGGTGKTTLTASFAYLTQGKAIFADADVDAPDLHLILHPTIISEEELYISKKAVRDEDKCVKCNKCGEVCEFNVISAYDLNHFKCEGCGLCVRICPEKALSMKPILSAKIFESQTRFGPFVHAEMTIGEGTSGRIVDQIRQKARKIAETKKLDFVIVDGSPGIGCPVIASITGVDLACIIVEPTLSGIHDLERIFGVAQHFKVKSVVCINKFDLNITNTNNIIRFCRKNNITIVGKIPFNEIVPKSIIQGKSTFELVENPVSKEIISIWKNIQTELHV